IFIESRPILRIEICEPEAGAVPYAIAFHEVRLTQTSVSVDLPADDGDGLLINVSRVPTLNGREVRLPRLIASTSYPAMGFQEIGSGGKCIGLSVEIDDAVAIAVDGIKQDGLGQELGLPDFAMHGAARA